VITFFQKFSLGQQVQMMDGGNGADESVPRSMQ
jgi:hypothetical protein